MPALQPATAKQLSPTDAAWLAGFFDGEGGVYGYKNGRGSLCWCIQIPNTHYPSVEHCLEITGCGHIQHKVHAGNGKKDQWHWRLTTKNDIIAVCKQMLPYLVTRKESVERALAQLG